MTNSTRSYLTFSLRTFFVLLTIACLWLGWKVEQARLRGRAIAAIVQAGGGAVYDGSLAVSPEGDENHFWFDFQGVPVDIGIREPLNASLAAHLSHIYNIRSLYVASRVSDSGLRHLDAVNDVLEITLLHADALTDAALEQFRRKHPQMFVGVRKASKISWLAPFAHCEKRGF